MTVIKGILMIIFMFVWSGTGGSIMAVTKVANVKPVTPATIYNIYKVNKFGAFFIYFSLWLLSPGLMLIYLIWALCTIGRR